MYVRDPSRVVVTGPLAAHAGGFCAELGRRGYARASAAELMQLMAHLSRWLGFEHLEPDCSRSLNGMLIIYRLRPSLSQPPRGPANIVQVLTRGQWFESP